MKGKFKIGVPLKYVPENTEVVKPNGEVVYIVKSKIVKDGEKWSVYAGDGTKLLVRKDLSEMRNYINVNSYPDTKIVEVWFDSLEQLSEFINYLLCRECLVNCKNK